MITTASFKKLAKDLENQRLLNIYFNVVHLLRIKALRLVTMIIQLLLITRT